MDPTGRYTKQQRIKVIDAYFAAESVLLTQRQCRKNFGRNNVPDGRTIQCLVAKFQKIGSVADTHKGRHRSSFGIIPENIQNYGKAMRNPPEKQQPLSNPSLTRNLHFQNISIEDLPRSILPRWIRYRIQILQRQNDLNEAEREAFCEDVSQRIENELGLSDLNGLNNVYHCDLGGASATLPDSRNLAIKRWIFCLWGTLLLPKSLLHCYYVRRVGFVAKYTSMISIGCCVINRPVGSILVSKESPRSAVYKTWKKWNKKIVKHNFGMKNKIGSIYLLDKKKKKKSYIKWRKYIQIIKLIKNYNPNKNQILVKNIHSFVPNCMGSEGDGGSNCQFEGKKTLKLI